MAVAGKIAQKSMSGQGNLRLDSRIASYPQVSLAPAQLNSANNYLSTFAISALTGQLAIGDGAVITVATAGQTNTISIGKSFASYSNTISIGIGDNTSGNYGARNTGAIALGYQANTGGSSGVSIGNAAAATGSSSVSIGYNSATGSADGVAIGHSAYASANYSTAIGAATTSTFYGAAFGYSANSGSSATDSGYGSVAIGQYATADFNGEFVFSCGYLAAVADAKTSLVTLRCQTTSATPVVMGVTYSASTTPTYRIRLTPNSTYYMTATVIGRNKTTAGNDYIQKMEFGMAQDANAASTVLVGNVIYDTPLIRGTSPGTVALAIDTTIGGPKFTVTGLSSTTVDWVCTVMITKVA